MPSNLDWRVQTWLEGDVTPSLTSYRSVVILSCSALVTLSLYLTYFPFRTICVLPARLYRTLWPTPPFILVRTVCASSQATPAYSGYYSHTYTWPFRSKYLTVLWARVSQLASDLTHLFGHFIALIMRSGICITKHTRSLPSSLHQHLRLLMPADEAHLCLLIAYWFLSNSPSLLCI